MKIEGTTRGEIFWMDCNDERLIVVTDKNHRLYDDRVELPVSEAMVDSISDPLIGIIEPVIVRNNGGKYEVVDGRQRVKAAREAQSRINERTIRIPLIVRSSVNDSKAAIMSCITNNQRTEETAVQKGRRAISMLETGSTPDEISKLFGVSWKTVSGWRSLAESPEAQSALESGLVNESKAVQVARSSDKQKALKAATDPKPEMVTVKLLRRDEKWIIKTNLDVSNDSKRTEIRDAINAFLNAYED